MVDDQVHIPLGKKFETGAFWQYHPEHSVNIFDTAFLAAAHGVTVIDVRPLYAVYACLQSIRVTKLRPPVSQEDAKKTQEIISAQFLFQPVKDGTDSALCTTVHKKGQKEFFLFQEERQEDFLGFIGRMYCIHFRPVVRGKSLEVGIHPALKYRTVLDLCIVALTGLEFHFPFEVDIPCGKEAVIQISVESPDGHTQFRMVCYDLVRGLSLRDQRRDDHILLSQFMLCHADTGAGIRKEFPVLSVSEFSIIAVFVGNGTVVYGFRASIADIGRLIEAVTAFPYKVRAGLVAGGTGSTFYITEDELAAHIRFPAVIAVDAEVMGIIENAFMVPVAEAVGSDLLGDGSRILTEIFGDLLKTKSLIQ